MQKDYIITLAWPEGMIASTQSWYDPFFSKKGKYQVGHSAIFKTDNEFDINQTYKFTYLSHYQFCTIIQNKKEIVFYLYNVAL